MNKAVGRTLRDAPKIKDPTRGPRSGPSEPEKRGMSLSPTEAADQLLTIVTEPSHSRARNKLSANGSRRRRGAKKA